MLGLLAFLVASVPLPTAAPPGQCACVPNKTCGQSVCPVLGGPGPCTCRIVRPSPVKVYFFTMRTCKPCKAYWPAFEAFADRNRLRATFVKVDIEDPRAADLVRKYDIQQVPRVVVTDDEYYTKFNGAPTDEQLLNGILDPSNGLRQTRTLPAAK